MSVEVHTEGDYNDAYGPTSLPTPTMPAEAWDWWSQNYGYPYRGQPSVLFDAVVEIPPRDVRTPSTRVMLSRPQRMGSVDAVEVREIDATISDDPDVHPGSGADRLRLRMDGGRVVVETDQTCGP